MSELEKLINEVGSETFRLLTESRIESKKSSGNYDPSSNTALNLEQAKRLSELSEYQVSSVDFHSDDEFFDIIDRVLDDWPEVTPWFTGRIGEVGYIDALYLCYDEVEDKDEFKEYCVVHFKNWMDMRPEDNEGICPVCDDRIDIRDSFEPDSLIRVNGEDENLWAAPDEFYFRYYPEVGQCLRMWWDD